MSTPLHRLLADLGRWGFDVDRHGQQFTATLADGVPLTFKGNERNAVLRAVHERAAEEAGQRIHTPSGKHLNAKRHERVAQAKTTRQAEVSLLDRQISRQSEADRVRSLVIRRYDELRSVAALMRHG